MAKWGEGDPRWIVEVRPDATNVNNWHWVEKNATSWSQDKLKELLNGLVIDDDKVFCEIKELTKLEGEATANNRKSKLIFFYEWVVTGKWSGKLKEGTTNYKGSFEIPNLSEEHSPSEVDVSVSVEKDTDEAYKVKEFMRIKGSEVIRQQLAKYIHDLREEYSKDIIKPTKGADAPQTTKTETKNNENKMKAEMNKTVSSTPAGVGVRIHTKVLKMNEEFKCQAADLYRALTNQEMVSAFTGGPATVEAARGEKFSMMGGNVTGEFVELVPDKKIVQRWRVKNWPEAHYSEVTIELEEREDKTVLHLKQTGVPDSQLEQTREGWKMHYWERMRQCFGFGARLF